MVRFLLNKTKQRSFYSRFLATAMSKIPPPFILALLIRFNDKLDYFSKKS